MQQMARNEKEIKVSRPRMFFDRAMDGILVILI